MKKVFNLLSLSLFFITANQMLANNGNNHVFIENKGQWPKEILYLTQNNGVGVWITKKGMIYDFYTIKEVGEETYRSGQIITFTNQNIIEDKITFSGKNKQQTYYNFFIGNNPENWASNVGLYKEVVIKDIYEGIDMRYYYQNGNLRYDYIVNPHADVNRIKIALDGAFNYQLNEKGELIFNTRFGEMKQAELYTYQMINGNKKTIPSSFKLNGKTLQFNIGDYNKSKPLIIDPLIWSTYIGGYENDRVYSVVEKNGNAYISGWTSGNPFFSPPFPTTPGVYDNVYNMTKAFVSKFNNNGSSLVYSTFIGPVSNGGSANVHADGVFLAVDLNGNAYITAIGKSGYPTTAGVFNSTSSSGVCVTKLNSTGTALLYSTFIGNGNPRAITVDNLGYAYITGGADNGFPTTPGAFDQTYNGGGDVIVTKLDTNASSLIFSTYLGGSGSFEEGFAIKVDNNYDVIVAGRASSANFPTTSGAYDITFNGGSGTFPYDGFVAKLNSTGSNLIFSTFLGGSFDDEIYGLDIDSNNDIYVTGYTLSTDFPYTPGVIDTVKNGTGTSFSNSDAFIVKLNNSGSSLIYSTFFGASGGDEGLSITVDQNKNAWICGGASTSLPITNDAFDPTPHPADCQFLACVNTNATTLLYSTFITGSTPLGGSEYAKSVTNDYNGNIYVAGWTGTSNFPVTPGAFQTTKANPSVSGYSDGFVLKYQHGTTTAINNIIPNESNFLIFPNPSSGTFTLQTKQGGVFELMDITGRVLNTYTIKYNTETIYANLPTGIYFIREKESGATQKLIIE